ncbi:short chain dehydrogenase domain-containing protein [Trichoderma breve]|uniref:Short chain dehydrogenase domain-containing protein n=1 Tax=Trichoderma breve TaxID=2034170 RepID=A0A9W9E2J3_9HYPO|nr:short chain dehydrogenase domain-containing protein [Trichoderma breve]KAJ4854405.1 short chain dehydrogenase domain-containing protein [Trichoderma breve]
MAITRKTCLVTGCSAGGVGPAFAEAFRNKGYHVFVTARTPSKIPERLREAANVTVIALDVTSLESIASAAEEVHTSIEEAKKLFDLNFFGVLAMMQTFSPMLVAARGCVVNNSSVGSVFPFAFSSIYNATKAALNQAGETWRLEMAPLGVRVITLVTGGIATKFFVNLQTLTFPENSYYNCVKDVIEDHTEENPYGVKPEVFAQDVLNRVEKGATGKQWVGGGASIGRFALWLLPQGVIDMLILSQKQWSKKLAQEHLKTD